MKKKRMAPVHPGEILLEQFLKPLAMSQNKLAYFSSGIDLMPIDAVHAPAIIKMLHPAGS